MQAVYSRIQVVLGYIVLFFLCCTLYSHVIVHPHTLLLSVSVSLGSRVFLLIPLCLLLSLFLSFFPFPCVPIHFFIPSVSIRPPCVFFFWKKLKPRVDKKGNWCILNGTSLEKWCCWAQKWLSFEIKNSKIFEKGIWQIWKRC